MRVCGAGGVTGVVAVDTSAGQNKNTAVGLSNQITQAPCTLKSRRSTTRREHTCGAKVDKLLERTALICHHIESTMEGEGHAGSRYQLTRSFNVDT